MKRALLALVFTLGALLLGSPSSLHAQNHTDPNWLYMDYSTVGLTWCVPGGVRTVIDLRMMDDPFQFEATVIHEKVHQHQLKQNRALCDATPRQALQMEAEAYCIADATIAVDEYKMNPDTVYVKIDDVLLMQFYTDLPPKVITQVWRDECGRKLGIVHSGEPKAVADGTSVKTLPVGPNK